MLGPQLESTVRRHSILIAAETHTSETQTDSIKSSSPVPQAGDSFSEMRLSLRDDILALVSPALEEQKKVNESWEARLSSISEKLREMSIASGVGEDITMRDLPSMASI